MGDLDSVLFFFTGILAVVIIAFFTILFLRILWNWNKLTPEEILGWSCFGSVSVGFISMIVGLLSMFVGKQLEGGVCLIASALSFGIIANALLRK